MIDIYSETFYAFKHRANLGKLTMPPQVQEVTLYTIDKLSPVGTIIIPARGHELILNAMGRKVILVRHPEGHFRAYYKSTGINSKTPKLWYPMLGCALNCGIAILLKANDDLSKAMGSEAYTQSERSSLNETLPQEFEATYAKADGPEDRFRINDERQIACALNKQSNKTEPTVHYTVCAKSLSEQQCVNRTNVYLELAAAYLRQHQPLATEQNQATHYIPVAPMIWGRLPKPPDFPQLCTKFLKKLQEPHPNAFLNHPDICCDLMTEHVTTVEGILRDRHLNENEKNLDPIATSLATEFEKYLERSAGAAAAETKAAAAAPAEEAETKAEAPAKEQPAKQGFITR
jgi:hypothetical protein